MDKDQKATVAFSMCGGIGPVTYKKLCTRFGTAHHAFYAPEKLLQKVLSQSQFPRFLSFRSQCRVEKDIERFEKQGVWILTCLHTAYPQQLLQLADPPLCLYGKGNKQYLQIKNTLYITLVGTRRPTKYGQETAFHIAQSLASVGIIIVSGMATGIDTLAHTGAIQGGGKTILVLGTAIDRIYPTHNRELYESVVQKHGCVISEYHPGMYVNQGMFVSRNRIVAGLCSSAIIVEGGVRSGSLITARAALEIGRDVYAVPGPICSDMSSGPNLLLREGAHVFTGVEEFLRDHSLQSGFFGATQTKKVHKEELSQEEQKIYDVLSKKELYIDELVATLQIKGSEALTYLSLLEVRGLVGRQPDGKFMVQ